MEADLVGADNTARKRKTMSDVGSALDSFARARWMLRSTKRGKRVRCYGRVLVEGGSGIRVSQRVVFLKGMIPTELRCAAGAELEIGAQTLFNYGVSVLSERSVRIGARCRFGSFVQVRDCDERRTAPVVIGDDVWLAHGVLVEPGVVIGDGSVVSAGAVVSVSIPPRMLAFGNPIRIFPLEGSSAGIDTERGSNDRQVRAIEPPDSPRAPSRDQVRAAIIDWLDDTRHFGEAANLITDDDKSLRDGGLLDSLGLVELVLMLEERFATPIDRELAARPERQSMSGMVDLVILPSTPSVAAP
jgi:acetyltransferase-like isoleucine patch superfamily enzyme/acyl carrier protein